MSDEADGALDEFPAAQPDGRRRSRRRIIGATVAGIALVAAGAVTLGIVLNGSGSGGARSPEAAVRELVSAVQEEDVLGALEVIDPAERESLRVAIEDAAAEGQRLELVGDTFTLVGVPGVDLAVQGLRLESEEIAPDVAVVHATDGEVTASFDKDVFPVGASVGEIGSGRVSDRADLSEVDEDVFLATVERDGEWYVSIAYTVAEYARRAAELEPPDAGAGVAAVGSATPEQAAQAMLDRLAAVDLPGLVALAPPGEGDAIRRYAPLWLDDAKAGVEAAKADGLSLTVQDARWEVTEDGDRAVAELVGYTLDGTIPREAIGSDDTDSDYESDVVFKPMAPTVIGTPEGDVVVIAPGEPVPDRIDDSMPRTPAAEFWDDYYADPDAREPNIAFADEDGVVTTTWTDDEAPVSPPPAPEPDDPMTLHVVHDGDCSTVTGEVGETMAQDGGLEFWTATGATVENVDGGFKLCVDSGSNAAWMFGVPALLSPASAFVDVPPVSLVRVDDQWYVSPVATVTNTVVDQLRAVPDGAVGLDSPLALYIYGTTRPLLELMLSGESRDQLSPECQAIAEFGADGRFERVVADPAPEAVRACGDGAYSEDFDEESSDSGGWSEYPSATTDGG